ncbi:MAG: NAD(P)/FAD-dependent oxidoreductase [Methanomicrobiales archaeon]|nr:NAD(P)/FAD-dependent oxidoreductase [Methanomicrobiales archaeon]
MITNKTVDVIIIGAGPAGLFCAANAASTGKNVLVIEKNPTPGKKLLLAGSGQCNITHEGPIHDFFSHYGDHGPFIKPALMNFPNSALISFFREHGLDMVTTATGKVFPATLKSTDVLHILEQECSTYGVTMQYHSPVQEVRHTGGQFFVVTRDTIYCGNSLVIATGGVSYPGTGSTGDGYHFASSLGHTIVGPAPALSPVIADGYQFGDLAGISFESLHFSLWRSGKKVGSHRGDLLFTHQGLSGPGILDYSRFIHPRDTIRLSFAGPVSKDQFVKDLTEKIATHPVSNVKTIVLQYKVPERLVATLLKLSGVPDDLTCAHLTKQQRNTLVTNLLEFPVIVAKLGGFNEAMVTGGGVSLQEIDPKSMESRLVQGLYFAGEVIDIDGDTGGYNLQAAFSTGYLAANAIITRK